MIALVLHGYLEGRGVKAHIMIVQNGFIKSIDILNKQEHFNLNTKDNNGNVDIKLYNPNKNRQLRAKNNFSEVQ